MSEDMRLTREQGAILSAYTGIRCGHLNDVLRYAERVLGRQDMALMDLADPATIEELQRASRADFYAIRAELESYVDIRPLDFGDLARPPTPVVP